MKKVIYAYIKDEYTKKIVEYLKTNHMWEPLLFISREEQTEELRNQYNQSIFVNKMKIRKGKFDYSFIKNKRPVDEDIINNLSKYEYNFLNIIQDTSGFNFNINQRKRFFHETLNYWNSIIIDKKPDLFVSYTVPHMPEDYALYILCKYHYKIPVLFLNIFPHIDNDYYTIQNSIENFSEVFKDEYNSSNSDFISKEINEYFDKINSNPKVPKHITLDYNILDKGKKNFLEKFIELFSILMSGKAFKEAQIAFKKNSKPILNAQLNNLEYFFFLNKLERRSKKLKKKYDKYITEPNYNDKYIYFAAPYQPEIASSLAVGSFKDIFLVLDILHASMPSDCKIYYKEHPRTFSSKYSVLAKDDYYYDKIKKYDKIVFVSETTNSFELVDNSIAVATVGGTVAHEALIKAKPALVFGNHHFAGCRSIFNINSYEDAKNAFIKINEGFIPKSQDVKKYFQAIINCSFKTILEINNYTYNELKTKKDKNFLNKNFSNIGKEFFKAYKRIYKI